MYKELGKLATEKVMTVKEVSEVLNVTDKHIRETIKKIFPDKMENGITTYLNEKEVTAISLWIKKNPYLNQSVEVKTKLEKNLIIRQAMQFLEDENNELIEQNKLLTEENNEMKPKVAEYDLFISGKDFQEVGTVAKSFGIGRNKFFEMLRNEKIFMENNIPYEEYIKYFKVVYKAVSVNGVIDNKPVTLFRPSGISYVAKRFNLVEVK